MLVLPLALAARSKSAKGEAAADPAHEYDAVVTGRSVLPFLVFNTILLAGFIAAGVWWAFFALWLLPMATWFPLVTRLRNIAEHACVEGSDADPFRAARTTRAAWWERAFIAPYWVNFHAEHHLFMHVPCWKLPALHRELYGDEYQRTLAFADQLRSYHRHRLAGIHAETYGQVPARQAMREGRAVPVYGLSFLTAF